MALVTSLIFLLLTPFASAERLLQSDSLQECMADSKFSATKFDVTFTPKNNSLDINIIGLSTITGNVKIKFDVIAYGLNALEQTINACDIKDLPGLCPMNEGPLNFPFNLEVPEDAVKNVPTIAYTVPDLDAKVRVYFQAADTGEALACVEAELSNLKTVYQPGVAWTVAVISGVGLAASAITSGLGHSNTAAHVAANAMALFGYMQAQALIGMTAVALPPIVASWTQNFMWSMGIIRVGFLQNIATWYQRSTGGTPTTILSDLSTQSVEVQKRSLEYVAELTKRAAHVLHNRLVNRSNAAGAGTSETSNSVVVKGIERVGFRARIEPSNIFLTGYIFFLIFVVVVIAGVIIFKIACEALTKAGRMKGDKFADFRNGWTTVLRGIMYRIILIGFPQMVVLCFWEFTRIDSGAEVVLAVFTVFTMIGILAWASAKVIRLARRSISMHKNPAYILYSDPISLNKWGFLYVQYKATAYFFVVPALIYILLKGMFVGLAQGNGVVQAIALLIIEAIFLIGVCVMRPYMDKKTNAFNISICVVNFLNAIFLLIFTAIFGQPGIVTGVMGVIFFIYNAAFTLILLILLLVASGIAIFSKNPDTRYQPMRDDRGSFIKSQSQLTTELDALGATARGEGKHGFTTTKGARIEDDDDSISGSSSDNNRGANHHEPPRSPMGSGFPMSDAGSGRHQPPSYGGGYNGGYNGSKGSFRTQGASPSPWQRGAGYE
ncbi:TRP-domain-containing protein [Polychaeton citri CBS 116435]|uniref:TRP-domain-containing protein n=1 Tax=Polychaeton citri CBS 116435 TaxID=1314669 RepID=A0A9P4Q5F9_9PEZI|nr:TRP-domain-containing protein [Polychaeton citri CBS 116435]